MSEPRGCPTPGACSCPGEPPDLNLGRETIFDIIDPLIRGDTTFSDRHEIRVKLLDFLAAVRSASREEGRREATARIDHYEVILRAVMEAIADQDYDGARVMCREALK